MALAMDAFLGKRRGFLVLVGQREFAFLDGTRAWPTLFA